MAGVVDRTVDAVLSQFDVINKKAANEQARLHDQRARYQTVLGSLRSITDPKVLADTKTALHSWIREQLAAEARFRDFSEKYGGLKANLKRFLETIHVTPPPYLGALPLVPVAIIVGLSVLVGVLGTIALSNNGLEKKIAAIERARALGLSPEDIKELGKTDLTKTLEAAAPLLGIVAVILLGPQLLRMVQSRRAA